MSKFLGIGMLIYTFGLAAVVDSLPTNLIIPAGLPLFGMIAFFFLCRWLRKESFVKKEEARVMGRVARERGNSAEDNRQRRNFNVWRWVFNHTEWTVEWDS